MQYLRNSGRFSYYGKTNQEQDRQAIYLSEEAYKISRIEKGAVPKKIVIRAANGLQKKIHPDVNPNSNTERLSQIS